MTSSTSAAPIRAGDQGRRHLPPDPATSRRPRTCLDNLLRGQEEGGIDSLLRDPELVLCAELALIRIGGDDPMPLAQLLGGFKRPDAGRAGHREGDVDTLVVLSKGQLLAQRRVLEGVGVGDHDIDVGIDRLRAASKPTT